MSDRDTEREGLRAAYHALEEAWDRTDTILPREWLRERAVILVDDIRALLNGAVPSDEMRQLASDILREIEAKADDDLLSWIEAGACDLAKAVLAGVAPAEHEGQLRSMLVTCREALESLPKDALGEGTSVETHPDGEAGRLRWPIRDELIDRINRALATASREQDSREQAADAACEAWLANGPPGGQDRRTDAERAFDEGGMLLGESRETES